MAKVIFDGAGEMPELNRITAKKNYASSSQAHKMGATAMFNDILHYLGKEKYPKLINEVEGQVAVRQHPVYAFQKIPIEGSEGQYNRKFIGLFTVGPDKGDKNYFGFTNSRIKDRAIRLEGTDHLKGVGFNYPWTVNGVDKIKYNHAEESLCIITGSDKTKWTKIWEQSVCGDKETEAEIEAYLKEVYKPAYEIAYYNNPLIVGVDMTLSEINSNIEAFGKRRKVKDDRQYSYCEFWIDGEYDIYYLDAQTNKYEKNGINLLSDLGITADEIAGMTIEEKNDLFISRRVARFKEEAKYYFCIDDAIYQLMFLFIIVASDNFEKNMYPYIMELLWRFFQDDLDSIFSTDNQAQNTKKYSAELHDFTDDTKSAYVFKGEDSAFWQLIELAYGDECKQMGRDIFQAMYDLAPRGTTTMEKLMAFFDEYFFNRAQKYFTPSAYNNDTEYSYEEAWNNKEYVASVDIHPLAQALGSQESTERAFLEKRLIYLMSKFSFGGFGSATDTDLGIISVRTQDPQSFTLTPAIDLYPTVLGGQAQSAVATERVMAGQSVTLPAVGGGNTNVYIVGADWLSDIGDLKDLKVDPSSVVTLTISSKRLRRIKVGDENADSVTSYLGSLSIQKCDSLETIDARNLQTLVGTVDLSNCPRLVEALFGGSNANAIIIAPGSKVEKLQFSDSITTIDLRNNTFLKDVEITNFSKIRFLRLENVPIINGFDVLRQAYNTDGQQLENIRIIGFTYTGGADDLLMLNNIAEGKDKDGNAHNYGSIDANGDPVENSLPVIEGNLHITEAVNRVTYDFVKGVFHALALTADNIVDYFIFADPEVSRIVAENWGDGTGTTLEQIEAINYIGTTFRGNTLIETFDELNKFTSLINISNSAFQDCSSLTRIDLRNVVTFSESNNNTYALYNCSSLRSLGDVSKLTKLYANLFSGCTNIEGELSFDSVTVAWHPGVDNSKVTKLNLPKLTEIRLYPMTRRSLASSCQELIEVNMPRLSIVGTGGVKDGIVANCPNLRKLDISSLNDIEECAFENNPSLSELILSPDIISIGWRSFQNCSSLPELILGDKVSNIGDSFINCSGLTKIIIKTITPPTLGAQAFINTNNCPIYVPDASVEAYKTATNWVNYAPRIQSIFYYLGYIDFVDPAVRDICIANFDTDGDGVVSMEEAAAVTAFNFDWSTWQKFVTFNEFKYFTGVTRLKFNSAGNLKEYICPPSIRIVDGIGAKAEKFTLNEGITEFSTACFRSNFKITNITIPSTTKKIGNNLFNTVPEWGNGSKGAFIFTDFIMEDNGYYKAVDGILYNSAQTMIQQFPAGRTGSYTTPAGVSLQVGCFGNSELSKIEVDASISILPGSLFYHSQKLETIILNGVTNIPEHCQSFYFCTKLKSLVIKTPTVASLGASSVFGGSDGIVSGTAFIYVPNNLVEDYKVAANWSTYANQIKPINVADTLPDIGSVDENDLYKIGEVYWKAEMVDNVLTWVEI